MNGQMDGCIHEWMHACMPWMDGKIDTWMDRQMDGCMDGQINKMDRTRDSAWFLE